MQQKESSSKYVYSLKSQTNKIHALIFPRYKTLGNANSTGVTDSRSMATRGSGEGRGKIRKGGNTRGTR